MLIIELIILHFIYSIQSPLIHLLVYANGSISSCFCYLLVQTFYNPAPAIQPFPMDGQGLDLGHP